MDKPGGIDVPFGGLLMVASGFLLVTGWGDQWLEAVGLSREQVLAQVAALLVVHHLWGGRLGFDRLFLLYSLPLVVSTLRVGSMGLLSVLVAFLAGAVAYRAAELSGPPPWLAVPVAVSAVAALVPVGARARLGAVVAGLGLFETTEPSLSAEEGVQLLWSALVITSLWTGVMLSLGRWRAATRPRAD